MSHPQPALAVDDRHGNIPIRVEYNIKPKEPDFDSLKDDWMTYEYFYYYDSEKKCDDFRLLLQDPSVKRIMNSIIE